MATFTSGVFENNGFRQEYRHAYYPQGHAYTAWTSGAGREVGGCRHGEPKPGEPAVVFYIAGRGYAGGHGSNGPREAIPWEGALQMPETLKPFVGRFVMADDTREGACCGYYPRMLLVVPERDLECLAAVQAALRDL
jgi:hypothetical protein